MINNKNLTNAQNAISQLGYRERMLEGRQARGHVLSDPEKDLLKSVKNTKKHIEENMFKDISGKIHQDLLKEHREIQKGYAKKVIPYTKNVNIQKHKRGKKLADELVPQLMKGEFPAMVGNENRALMLRRAFGKHPMINTAIGLGSAGGLGALLYKMLSGENPHQ